ncbi:hypothetical protein EVAR_80008_1 [Eumeta japonica]|uniref:Uncharacterized protein n=1 Tax=Eumeta variegata TaxID=151549 RepID=A0A4C1WP97_EUMVA|nr:hypothetical protein EVAR_80008_1 [Eumeta japonica]
MSVMDIKINSKINQCKRGSDTLSSSCDHVHGDEAGVGNAGQCDMNAQGHPLSPSRCCLNHKPPSESV